MAATAATKIYRRISRCSYSCTGRWFSSSSPSTELQHFTAMANSRLCFQQIPSQGTSTPPYSFCPCRPYRRDPPNVYELDLEEQVAKIDMDPKKMMQPGDPNAIQAVIKDVMPVGYFVSLPSGRDGYLPADDLGFSGGLAILQRLFKEGQEITVRIVCRGGAGREIVSIKKPEFAPPSEQKTIESLRLHFENEKKNRMNPRNRRRNNY